MKVRRQEPIGSILGKDLSTLIAKHVHEMNVQALNAEYFRRLEAVRGDFSLVFHELNTHRKSFMFNYRHASFLHHHRNRAPIFHWHLDKVGPHHDEHVFLSINH